MSQKRCFVVMGFGIKTDLATGRKLNLDKSYQALIKPVVEEKGIICVRADEIPNSGSIDVPMYKELYKADIVVADLSTANINAFYELGVRYGLRPRTTIVISEDQLSLPFDVNHIKISKYAHLGDAIDYFEVIRFQKLLGETIDSVLANDTPDSPVYTFLHDLIPPALREEAEKVNKQVTEAISNSPRKNEDINDGEDKNNPENKSLAIIVSQGEEAIKSKEYALAKGLFSSALLVTSSSNQPAITSNSSYLYQRLAFATYKACEPDTKTALKDAIALLDKLDLLRTNDSETVALAGAIKKKIYETGEGSQYLDEAILLYQRAYYLLNNRYNGINLAYLLNSRANSALDETEEEKIADTVWAKRIRSNVLALCEKDWKTLIERQKANSLQNKTGDSKLLKAQQAEEKEQKFWILVNKAEAHFGLGNMEEYRKAVAQAEVADYEDWMMESFTTQIEALGKLLNKQENALKPQRKEMVAAM